MKNDFKPAVGHRFSLRGDWGGVLDCEVLAARAEQNAVLHMELCARRCGLQSEERGDLHAHANELRHPFAHGAGWLPAGSEAGLRRRQGGVAAVLRPTRNSAGETVMAEAATKSIVVERVIPHAPEKIWGAHSGAMIAEWLMKNDFKAVVGHKFQFHATPMPGWKGYTNCEVLEVDEPRSSSTRGAMARSRTAASRPSSPGPSHLRQVERSCAWSSQASSRPTKAASRR